MKDGWAAFAFRDKFGTFPTGLKTRSKATVSDEVKAFVGEQRKRYLASKAPVDGEGWGVRP
jgi:hypothetical protein